jgi:hypothetical protein
MSNEEIRKKIRECIEEMDRRFGSILGPIIYCYSKYNKLDELDKLAEEIAKEYNRKKDW